MTVFGFAAEGDGVFVVAVDEVGAFDVVVVVVELG